MSEAELFTSAFVVVFVTLAAVILIAGSRRKRKP